jgi:type IV pilus assembly protein PilA
MFCSRCGSEVVPTSVFCSACGAPVGVGAEPVPDLTRPGVITLLAVLQFIGAAIWLFVGIFGSSTFLLASDTDRGFGVIIFVALIGGFGLLQLACGIGLLKLKPYGRILQLVFAFIGLLGFPIGTVISILILIYMFKPGIKVLFSGKPASALTPVEVAHVAALRQGSQAATIIIVIFVALASIAAVGIIAAIAIPGLLRARVSGNEASAIGSLRSIVSAEAAYAAAAGSGGYAITLQTLSAACPGSAVGFISPELSRDPSVKSGYEIILGSAGADAGPRDCNGVATEMDYYATATPVSIGSTGIRGFSTSSAGTIFFDPSGAPPTRATTLAGTANPLR